MNEQENNKPDQTDEIGSTLESGAEVNAAIDQQGYEATLGIPRDKDAARHDPAKLDAEEENDAE